MKNIKIIFSDIDGTLLNSKHLITAKTRRKILQLEQQGILFILVSARMPKGVEVIRDLIGNHAPIVCYNGGLIYSEKGEVMHSCLLDLNSALAIKQMLDQDFPMLCCNTYGFDQWIVDDKNCRWVQREEQITGLSAVNGSVAATFAADGGIHKFLLMGEEEEIKRAEARIRADYPDLSVALSNNNYLEVMHGDVKKSVGVDYLCAHYGYTPAEAMAFGDGFNDIDMLQRVKYGYAMGNAPIEVQESASFMTQDNDHEGVLSVLEEIENMTSLNGGALLLTAGKKSALFDCGMAHQFQLELIKEKLKGAPLDYFFLTHSHYDHLGALPEIRKQWPDCLICGTEYAKYVLTRPGALATIRKFTMQAAQKAGVTLADYSDELMKIDVVLKDHEIIDLGGIQVQMIPLLGHTRCSAGYWIDQKVLVASESIGYLSKSGEIFPSYLVSGSDALRSVEICRELAPEVLVPPHKAPIRMAEYPDFWEKCRAAIQTAQALIINSHREGKSAEEIFQLLKERYWVDEVQIDQPLFAFEANTRVMIQRTLAETLETN